MHFVIGFPLSLDQMDRIQTSPRAQEWMGIASPSRFILVEDQEKSSLCLPLSLPKKWSSLEVEVAHFCSVVHQILGSTPLPEQLLFFRP